MIIAIDGPAASGKGTLGRLLAQAYGLAYLDTGAIYRAAALAALRAGVDVNDEAAVTQLARQIDLTRLDDPDLRRADTGRAASRIAALPAARAALLDAQRAFAARPGGAVLDGRDIGTVVCPDADVKLFVVADLDTRARRRAADLRAMGEAADVETVRADLAERDRRDAGRADAPMKRALDARLLDTTEMTIDAAFEHARRFVEEARGRAGGD